MGKYQLKTSQNAQIYWVLKATNNQVVLTSETYTSKQNAIGGIGSSKAHLKDENFHKGVGINGQFYFVQIAKNGEKIGLSEMYSTAASRDDGIKSVQREATNATIEDLTGIFAG